MIYSYTNTHTSNWGPFTPLVIKLIYNYLLKQKLLKKTKSF